MIDYIPLFCIDVISYPLPNLDTSLVTYVGIMGAWAPIQYKDDILPV